MNLANVYLTTFIPEFPRIYNYNNQVFRQYLNLIYDESTGIIVVPVNTAGRVKGATGEFVNLIADNFTVKNQFTNLYQNYTTIDYDYYSTYVGADASVRDASTWDNSHFRYVDVNKPYYKIANDISTAFTTTQMGQEIELLFDLSTGVFSPFNVLLDPCAGGGKYEALKVTYKDASSAWVKLIAVEYDSSLGTTWVVKQFGGTISKVKI